MPGLRLRAALGCAAALIGAALLMAAPATAARAETVDRGIVQQVAATSITLRALDGSAVSIPLGPQTRFILNGSPATVAAIGPGQAAAVFHDASLPARLVRASGGTAVRTLEGVVVSVIGRVLTLRLPDGSTTGIRVGQRTAVVRANGRPARRIAVQPGRAVKVTYVPGRVARLIVLLPVR